jgi:acyl-homoserine lactone acylase PvdQ
MQVAGWIPQRALSPGLLPLPGRARWYDWADAVPFEALPSARLADGKGWIVVADAPFSAVAGHEPIEWVWRSGERASRIEQLLEAAAGEGPVGLRSMIALQADVVGVRGPALIRHALALLDGEVRESLPAEARELAAILEAWDGESSADSIGAAVYHEFVATLSEALLTPHLGRELLQRYLALPRTDPEGITFEAVRGAALDTHADHWEDRAAIVRTVRESLYQAWLRLTFSLGANRGRWSWGRVHQLRFEPFGGLGRWLGKGAPIGPYPYGGSRGTVNAAGFDTSEPFAVRVASTARFAVDASALDQMLTALAPGQSEHPDHPHYRDGIPDWLVGRSNLLATDRLLVEEVSLAHLVLEPVR